METGVVRELMKWWLEGGERTEHAVVVCLWEYSLAQEFYEGGRGRAYQTADLCERVSESMTRSVEGHLVTYEPWQTARTPCLSRTLSL